MKYAKEIQDLLPAFPGRDFRMVQIVRYVANGRELTLRERRAMRKGVARVLEALVASGMVSLKPPEAGRGAPVFYTWVGLESETSTFEFSVDRA